MNNKIKKLSFLLILGGGIVFSSNEVFGGKILIQNQTDLGFYESSDFEKMPLPSVRITKKSKHLPEFPVKDQSVLGTCTSFAVSGCFKINHPDWDDEISEAEFTILAETLIGDCKPGLPLGNALKFAKTMGFLKEHRLTYQRYLDYVLEKNGIDRNRPGWNQDKENLQRLLRADICEVHRDPYQKLRAKILSYNTTMEKIGTDCRIDGTVKNDISPHKLGKLYPLHHSSRDVVQQSHVDQITLGISRSFTANYSQYHGIGTPADADIKRVINAIASNYVVTAAAEVYDNCWMPPRSPDATIKLPSAKDKHQGSHAFNITGYDLDKKCFRIQNSWGQDWADNGYAWLPFEYIRQFATELIAVGK